MWDRDGGIFRGREAVLMWAAAMASLFGGAVSKRGTRHFSTSRKLLFDQSDFRQSEGRSTQGPASFPLFHDANIGCYGEILMHKN